MIPNVSGRPFIYVRKSRDDDARRDESGEVVDRSGVSWDVQVAQSRSIAALHGDVVDDRDVLSDWNLSGRKGVAGRPDYARLVAAIESGECSAVYSYNLSRLSRSVKDLLALVELADSKGVPIRLVRDQIDTSSASGRMLLTILGAVNAFTAEVGVEAARDAIEAKRRKEPGWSPGPAPFAHPEVVVDAYLAAGSYTGAAKLLSAPKGEDVWIGEGRTCSPKRRLGVGLGVPSRNGNSQWHPSAVRAIVERVRPDLIVNGNPKGRKRQAPFAFHRLVRCWCGRTMTGMRKASGPMAGYTSYRCTLGRLVYGHGPTTCPESALLRFAKVEAARFRVPDETIELEATQREQRAALVAKRGRIVDAAIEGLIDKPERDRRLAEVDDAVRALDATRRAVSTPDAIDWDATPEAIAEALRALWQYVQLGRDMRPASVVWNVPPEYVADAA